MILCRVDNEVSINSARNCKEELSFVCSLHDMCHNEICEDCPSNKCQFSGANYVRNILTWKMQYIWIVQIPIKFVGFIRNMWSCLWRLFLLWIRGFNFLTANKIITIHNFSVGTHVGIQLINALNVLQDFYNFIAEAGSGERLSVCNRQFFVTKTASVRNGQQPKTKKFTFRHR